MKKLFALFLFLSVCLLASGQQLTISMEGGVRDMTSDTVNPDMDAKTYFPKYDDNDALCALIKVTVTNPLKNALVLDVGGVGVVGRENRENGEIWFWIPTTVINMKFSCMGYNDIPKIPVSNLKPGYVYRITFRNDAVIDTVTNVGVTSNYLKFEVTPKDAIISIGKNPSDYSLLTEYLTDGVFAKRLDLGRYYYKIEHEMYETKEGSIELNSDMTSVQKFSLSPAYGYLNIKTVPSGATVFVDGERVGVSPVSAYGPIKRGEHRIRVQKNDYHSSEQIVRVTGDGSRQDVQMYLDAQFATVTCTCDDSSAELYVDSEYKAKGAWTGSLSSSVTHTLEARRKSHRSQSISFTVTDGQVVTKKVGSPVPLYGMLAVEALPTGCSVAVDGKTIGKSPLVHQLLIGDHKVELSHDGYISESHNVVIKHNEETLLNKNMTKGRLKATVTLSTASPKDALYRNGIFLGYGSWSGVLEEGDYVFHSRQNDCHDGELKYTLRGSSPVRLSVPSPVRKTGTASFRANKAGADIYVKDSDGKTYTYKSPSEYNKLPTGKYSGYASKTGYVTTSTKSFNIYEGMHSDVVFDLKKKRWIKEREYFAHNFLDFNYGFGIPVGNEGRVSGSFLGLDYTYLKTHLGIHTSASFGLEYNEASLHAGPIFRLTSDYNAVDLQLYAGLGAVYAPYSGPSAWNLSGDAGVRMNFDEDHDWSWFSLSAGCMFTGNMVVPKIGTSILLPASISYLTDSSEYDFAAHFLDFLTGYDIDNDEFLMGANYTWCRTHLGFFGSFMAGLDGGLSFSAGPVIRLTSDLCACDLQLYGGPGYMNGYVMGDLGVRFGWKSGDFSWWDFSIGCQMYNGSVVPTVGLGLGISLTVVTAGMAALLAMFSY